MTLKLYVWEDVLYDYGPGMMFALASSVEEARRLIREHTPHVVAEDLAQEPQVFTTPKGYAVWGSA